MAYSSLGMLSGGSDLKQRLSKALLDVSGTLASVKSGALVQVWMPEHTHDGTIVLSCQGLPFAVAGVGDLLALFRCVSVRYRFSTDVMKPTLMGAIGRVYSTLEPEMSHNVQKYDKQVYLRVSEAQRCRVHSTLMVPIFGSDSRDTPLAVFELVQGDRDVTFPAVLSHLTASLQNVNLFTTDLEIAAAAAGLRKWPMYIDVLPAVEYEGAGAGRLSPTHDEPRRLNSSHQIQEVVEPKETTASSNVVATEEKSSPSTSKGDEVGSRAVEQASHSGVARLSAGNSVSQPFMHGGFGALQLPSSAQVAGTGGSRMQGGVATVQLNMGTAAAAPGAAPTNAAAGAQPETAAAPSVDEQGFLAAASDGPGGRQQSGASLVDSNNAQQFATWLAQQTGTGNTALGRLRALLEQQQQRNKEEQAGTNALGHQPTSASQPQPMDTQAAMGDPSFGIPQSNLSASPPKGMTQPQPAFDLAAATGAVTAAAAVAVPAAAMPDKQIKLARSSSVQRTLGTGTDADDGDGEDISSGGEEDESDEERPGSLRNNNRVGGGAGKRLRFEDLQAQFGLGLKEAANNLGICATTLKRACRRHGIKRWPRRQIAKLSKALNQMGYNGAPPPGLVQNAVVSAGTSAVQTAAKPKPAKRPDAAALQQATQLLFQQQLGAAAAAAAASGGGMFPNMTASGMVMGAQLQGIPQSLHGMYGVASQIGQQQLQQQQTGMFSGTPFMGPMGTMIAQHGSNGPSAAIGHGPQTILSAIGGLGAGLGAAMQMQGIGSLTTLQGGPMGAMQSGNLGLQLQGTGGMQLQAAGSGGLPMHGHAGMLHPLLAGGSYNVHPALQQQQIHQQVQLQLQVQQQQQQQQPSHLMQQHARQQQHDQVALQQQIQQQVRHQQQQTQQLGPGQLQHVDSTDAMGWLAQGQGASLALIGPGSGACTAMDVSAPRISCGDAQSPFSALGMSPGMGSATPELCGLAEVPEDFIQNLNSTGTNQFSQMLKSGTLGGDMELMDLLSDDIAAR
ncbi:hypothetical protein Vretimale_4836 [Volvox reticuliferus]|uniref:RWP-RK domain-containing protein n=1 Tax=Volvox reticuliferus TaxID=1737510 RepID=A0A8J4C4N5_9CHLO|nr:hypothetical protein Vretifemale_3457 [Volvox reticuliferus]GIL99691.1 hypothetical protein Vretimale_4836 [Volvox reticuliferus]